MMDDFSEEVEKLNDKTSKTNRINQNINDLKIEALINSSQKALYVILGHMYEDKTKNLMQK